MKYHTIKSERTGICHGGAYATYPVYEPTGKQVAVICSYAENVAPYLRALNEKPEMLNEAPFYKNEGR